MKRSPVVHFEMPAKDKARVMKFYNNAFGWNMVQTGVEMGNYIVAQTAETDEKNMVKTAGAINGGFFDYAEKPGFTEPHIVISVENLDESIESVKKEGGTVDGAQMDIPTIGKYVSIIDTEGNRVGLLQPSM